MRSGAPLISIGLPVFNGQDYLPTALNCLLSQDFDDFELIISDNASTDATEAICQQAAAADPRIRYYRNDRNIGASANYKRVYNLSRGVFFKWASHDDECHPSLLRRCLETFECASDKTVLVFPRAVIIDEVGQVVEVSPDGVDGSRPRPADRLASLMAHGKYGHPLWGLIRSDALRRTRLMGHVEADHVLLAELALLGEMIEIPEFLHRQRRHAQSAIRLHRTPAELLAWHDPTRSRALNLPQWMSVRLEYFRGIRHVQPSWRDRQLSYAVVLAVPCWTWFLRWTGPIRHRLGLYRHGRGPAASPTTEQSLAATPSDVTQS